MQQGMTELIRIGFYARSSQACLATAILLSVLAAAWGEDNCSAGSGSRSLLQVSSGKIATSAGQKQEETFAICAVQQSSCFDMPLDPRWGVGVPEVEAASTQFGKEPQRQLGKDEVQLVITRSGEDLRWLNALPQVTAIVYNRGGLDSLLPASRSNLIITKQENRGREDEVMLSHIISNYDNLPDITVFLQGWPFGHCPGLVQSVRTSIESLLYSNNSKEKSAGGIEGLMPITGTFWEYDVMAGKNGLAEQMFESHHYTDPLKSAKDLYNKTCTEVLGGQSCPSLQWVAEGAQWAVSKKRIRSTPRHVYEGALKIGEGWQSKFRGLVLEALWPTLWGASGWHPTKVNYVQGASHAYRRARSNDGYCATATGRRALMFSCEARMEFCERKRHAGIQTSQRFEIERKRFQVYDASPSEPWHMMVEIEPVLWGSATWKANTTTASSVEYMPKLIDLDSSLHLEETEADLPRQAVTWRMTAKEHGFALARQSSSGDWLYLGCDGNHSKLVKEEVGWKFLERLDGWVALRSKDHLWLTIAANQDGARLHCLQRKPAGSEDYMDKTFQINLLLRSDNE